MNAFSDPVRSFDRTRIPHGIFTMPHGAGIGMTEAQGREAGHDPYTRPLRMDTLARSRITGDIRGMVKIVAVKAGGRLLGVRWCSLLATETLQASVLAVNRKLPVSGLADLYNIFPTSSEAVSICAARFRKKRGGDPKG